MNIGNSDWTEDERLARLRAYNILDTIPEHQFDELVELASRLCGTPMSLVSLIDEKRQWFKARKGLEATQTPREVSFCAQAMLQPGIFEVLDTLEDPRFRANDLVLSGPKLRYYAGAPLVTEDNVPLGMLCVLDDKPREPLTSLQRFALQTLARQVMAQIELRRAVLRERADARELQVANDLLASRMESTSLELRLSQDALHQAQKMEAVGQLTGGIAHDFNNLLQGITGSIAAARKLYSLNRAAEADRFLTNSISATQRAAALTHRLLAFSRRQPLDPKAADVNAVLESVTDLIERTCGELVEVRVVLDPDLWLTRCDSNQLENAVLNLAINARDAMPGGGSLTVETSNAERESREFVCICVSDTGVGMPPEVQARAFDPFFTTKPAGQGTGLGLSMTQGFLRQCNGRVELDSEPGRGTTVKLFLPRFNGDVDRTANMELATVAARSNGETVLVIEDEIIVQELLVQLLADLGYRVLAAADGPSALRIIALADRIDLLITDVGLPGLSGRQVADAARRKRPDVKVLFITGYADLALEHEKVAEPGTAVLSKPFAMDELARRARLLLDGT